MSHSIFVNNLPSDCTVTYTGNEQSTTGKHLVKAIVKPGEYIISATFNDKQILEYNDTYYHKYYGLDLTGYTFKVYFDNNGYYQDEYSDFGYVKKYSCLNTLEYAGAIILYYND